jgi:hypothetical protein
MMTKMKLVGAIAAVAAVLGLGTTVAFSDAIDQKLTDLEQEAEASDGSDVTSWRAVWRWGGYRPTTRYYSGYRYAGYRYGAYRAGHHHHYGYARRAWTPGRWSWGGYRRGYYRYW